MFINDYHYYIILSKLSNLMWGKEQKQNKQRTSDHDDAWEITAIKKII